MVKRCRACFAGLSNPEIAQEHLERAIAGDQEAGHAHMLLGVLAMRENDYRTADKHWKEAEKIARRTRDIELEERVQDTRILFSGPPDLMNLLRRLGAGPGGAIPFPNPFDDEYDDDDFF